MWPGIGMDWRQFTMNLESLEADRVEEVFSRHGVLAVTLTDAGDDPVLEPARGETPLWHDTRITGLFQADVDMLSLREDLLETFGLSDLPANEVEELAERRWEREWLRDFHPMRFGDRLWVSPNDMDVDASDAVVVRLDPGLAFGTGTHETTALCLEWLDRAELEGGHVLDVGCGSGILAIAALSFGAATVDGVDIDPQALSASRQNADHNGVGDRLRLSADLGDFEGQYDVVLANILSGTLIDLAEELSKRTVHGGALVLSGILSSQTETVVDEFARWFTLEPPAIKNDWARITGTRH